jgi:hypothetical protein
VTLSDGTIRNRYQIRLTNISGKPRRPTASRRGACRRRLWIWAISSEVTIKNGKSVIIQASVKLDPVRAGKLHDFEFVIRSGGRNRWSIRPVSSLDTEVESDHEPAHLHLRRHAADRVALRRRLGRLKTLEFLGGGAGLRRAQFFAYLAYAVAVWPGLDVVTLHVIAYPTVADPVVPALRRKGRPATGRALGAQAHGRFLRDHHGAFRRLRPHRQPGAASRPGQLDPAGCRRARTSTPAFAGVVAHGEDAAKGSATIAAWKAKLARWAGAWRWRAWMACVPIAQENGPGQSDGP